MMMVMMIIISMKSTNDRRSVIRFSVFSYSQRSKYSLIIKKKGKKEEEEEEEETAR
jgi:hypothetical protein